MCNSQNMQCPNAIPKCKNPLNLPTHAKMQCHPKIPNAMQKFPKLV